MQHKIFYLLSIDHDSILSLVKSNHRLIEFIDPNEEELLKHIIDEHIGAIKFLKNTNKNMIKYAITKWDYSANVIYHSSHTHYDIFDLDLILDIIQNNPYRVDHFSPQMFKNRDDLWKDVCSFIKLYENDNFYIDEQNKSITRCFTLE